MTNSTEISKTQTDFGAAVDRVLATPIPVIATGKALRALRTLDAIFAHRPSDFAWIMITIAAEVVSLAGSALEEFCADDAIEL